MYTRTRSTRKAKDAASNFVKKAASGRNANPPTPEKEISATKASKEKQNQGKSKDLRSRKSNVSSAKSKATTDSTEIPAKTSNRRSLRDRSSSTKEEKLKQNVATKTTGKDSGEEESDDEVTIVPRYGPNTIEDSGEVAEAVDDDDDKRARRDSSPQVVLSPTSKYITGKSGSKSQIFKLSLAPGSEGQLIQTGGTVKIGTTLLKITPKSSARKEDDFCKGQGEKSEDTDQEDYVSSLDTSIDEFQILDQSLEDDEDEDVSYPSVQQAAFFSAFGLVKKTELPKDGVMNKLHRSAGGKLRRVLKPNFAPGMVYKDGKIVIEDATESSPRTKAKILAKGTEPMMAQKLDFSEEVDESPSNSPKPKKREWLKPPPRKSTSPTKDVKVTKQSSPSKYSKGGKNKGKMTEGKLKRLGSFPGDSTSKKPNAMSKSKSTNDIDLNMLPSRRSSRQRDAKRKEWKHLLRANPDEFEEDPQWEEEEDKRKHRSETRMAKKLEREKKNESVNPDPVHSDTSSDESEAEIVEKPSSSRTKSKREQCKEAAKQIKAASSSKKYADIYDKLVLKRVIFNRIRKQTDWKLAIKMLDAEQRKVKQRKLQTFEVMENIEKGKKVVTKGMGVYEGVSWEVSHIEESNSPQKNKLAVETVIEEIITPDGDVIKVKVEKELEEDDETLCKQTKKKKKPKVKMIDQEKETSAEDKPFEKLPLSPKFVKLPVASSTVVKGNEHIFTPPVTRAGSRCAPMIVILGADGRPLPPARSSYLCDKIRSTLEEVVQKPEMLRKGRVLELKVPKHKIYPRVVGQSSQERDQGEIEDPSPSHQSFLPIVSVKTDFQRELECQVPHMCNICWVNDHMYCSNMKRLEEDLPYTGGCMHYIPCRHYRHLQEHKMVNQARFQSVRKWQESLAVKYFEKVSSMELEGEDYEAEDLALVEDEDGNFVAVNASGVKLGEESNVQFSPGDNSAEKIESESLTATGTTSPLPYISSSQDSGYQSELPDSQQTNAADTSMESIEAEDDPIHNETTALPETNRNKKSNEPHVVSIASPLREHCFSANDQIENDDLMCEESLSDSDTEAEAESRDLTPPAGTEILNIQIRARAAQIARSLVFDNSTINEAQSLCNNEEIEYEDAPDEVPVEIYGAEVILGEPKETAEEKLVRFLQHPPSSTTHYEFLQDGEDSDIEETSEFIDIKGRKHRVIKVHIAKLDEESRDELMKSISTEEKKPESRSLGNHPSQVPDYGLARKRKRSGSIDSNESDEGESKKRPSPSGGKKGLMQKTDVYQFSLRTQKAMRGPLSASSLPAKAYSEDDKNKGRKERLSMQPIKINSTEAELPQELQEQSTSGEDGSQVLTFTTKEIREKKPELLSYIKRAGLAPVIAEKLKAEKASIEKMVRDAEAQLSKLQDQLGEQKLLDKALTGEMKTVKEELQELQQMVVEDEAQAAKYRIKKSYLENRRRFLEKKRDNCAQGIDHLKRFQADGTLPEGCERDDSQPSEEKSGSVESEKAPVARELHTPPPEYPPAAETSSSVGSRLQNIPSPPQIQRVTKPPAAASLLQQKQTPVSEIVQMLPQQTTAINTVGQQQYLQIVGEDGNTQLIQIAGNDVSEQVFELVSGPGQQSVLKPVSVPKQGQQYRKHVAPKPQVEQMVQYQYVMDTPQGQVVLNADQIQEQVIIDDGGSQGQVQEQVVITEGIHGHEEHIILSDGQTEQVVVTEGVQEQVVMSGYPHEQIVEEVVMEQVSPQVVQQEIVVSSNARTLRPTLQSLLRKQPEIRPKPAGVSLLKPHFQQRVSNAPMMIMTQSNAPSSQVQGVYSVPGGAQTVMSTGAQTSSNSVVVTTVPGVSSSIQADSIIETAFVTATQDDSENGAESNPRGAVQVSKQPHVLIQQQAPQQQQVLVTQGQSGEMMNIDDIEVQPLQASQEDLMRTMESIASELLGVSSIDLAP